ncbi:MAG TPA: lamin tail domain-containing protein [Saprospiraceae bacterium]|nr:lamin tail domain-containing protein [Saprospiraceae bacterium]
MKSIFFTLIIVLVSAQAFSQSIEDDFSNENLNQWTGDLQDFIIENEELRLNATAEGSSRIYAPFAKSDTLNWSFDFKMNFPPSNSNFLEIYLYAKTDTLDNTDALFLRIGESGGDDKVQLFKRENGSDSLLANSTPGSMSDDPEVRMQIEKKGMEWTLRYRNLDSLNFTPFFLGNIDDVFLPPVNYFGFSCNYTSTRRNRFFFDNIRVAPPQEDTLPPSVEQFNIPRTDRIELLFSEELDSSSIDSENIQLTPNQPIVSGIEFNPPNGLEFLLNGPLESGEDYLLTVEGFEDLSGNQMLIFDTVFQVFYPDTADAYDLVIQEIMADPSPAVGLPEVEYLEIFNRSDKTFNLEDYTLTSGSSSCQLPNYNVLPGDFLVITDNEDAALFPFVDHVVAVDGLINLSNSGDDILLSNPKGEFVHFIAYSDSWYRNNERADGGYSLEMINNNDPCLEAENWRASQSLSGGTPGFQNSVASDTLIVQGPNLLSVYPQSPDSILLRFDRRPGDKPNQLDIINIEGISISRFTTDPLRPLTLGLILATPLLPRTTYTIRIESGFEDCTGKISGRVQEMPVQLPETPETGDLIINEILTDPIPGAEDYLELFNRSDKVITLEPLAIRNAQNDQTVALDLEVLVFPGTYAVLTEDIPGVLDNYEVPNPQWLYESDLPSFNNDEGNVQIGFLDVFGLNTIDEMTYRPEMHYAFLDNLEGISLEKLNPNLDGMAEDNWHSAAQAAGYGTPTSSNSQLTDASPGSNNSLSLSSNRLSPDQDGFEDVLLINYDFDKPGYKADVKVFSDKGQLIRVLGKDVLLPRNGQLKWDGLDDNATIPPLGIYIILVEALHPEGDVIQEKLPCVLAKRL